MFGRILCLMGLHRKVLDKVDGGPSASDVYYCKCARPNCKWSKPDVQPLPESQSAANYPTSRISR